MGGSTRNPGVLQRDDSPSQVRARALGSKGWLEPPESACPFRL